MRYFGITLVLLVICLGSSLPISLAYALNDAEIAKNLKGEKLYDQHCTSCHNRSVARAPHRSMLQFLSTKVIHKTLTEGVMRDQARTLTAEEKVILAETITGSLLTDTTADLAVVKTARSMHSTPPPAAYVGRDKRARALENAR
ncbi:MAG: mono/diheme cytochrome c family protein [Limisphaerales bacterium]|jgi:mono/diheme cytochrome c family protein